MVQRYPEAANRSYTHEELLKRHTGWETEFGPWTERRKAWALIQAQTEEIAERLEALGIQARLPASITTISAVTLQEDTLDSFRPIRFLPAIAARERRPYLNAMRYWLETNPQAKKYVRFAVVTYGTPIHAGDDLREAISDLTRRISRWAHYVWKRFGIEVLYRGIEYTWKDRDGSGEQTLHLHANVLYWPHRQLKTEEWTAFLTISHEKLASHWKDNGRVNDVAEIVKYVVKPEDLRKLEDDDLVWLYENTFKKRISAPMNTLRIFFSNLTKERKKVVTVSARGLRIVTKARKLDRAKAKEDRVGGGVQATNVILGLTLPQWRHTPYAEPIILVQNRDKNAVGKAAEAFRNDVETLHAEALMYWQDNGAPSPDEALRLAEAWDDGADNVVAFRKGRRPTSYKVHTSRVTVHGSETVPANDAEPRSDTVLQFDTEKGLSLGNGPRAPSFVGLTPGKGVGEPLQRTSFLPEPRPLALDPARGRKRTGQGRA